MPNFIGNLLSSKEQPNYLSFTRMISGIFVVFLFVGLVIGFFIARTANKPGNSDTTLYTPPVTNLVSYEGIVTYVDEFMYPEDKISYTLLDSLGEDVILLKARDQKLEVSEGHYVQVNGTVKKLSSGKGEYLLVENLVVKNVTN